MQPHPLPDDQIVTARYEAWSLKEPAVPPDCWVLFHPEQYQATGFPFEPLTPATECEWICCRHALTGEPWWAPAELVWLRRRSGHAHRVCAGLSTGLASGRTGQPVLLRGLMEVIERDAVMGAWWGRYGLAEYSIGEILAGLPSDIRQRIVRPNLTYRCYRIESPFSDRVMMVTLTGEDREGWCFSIGAACRETATASWNKVLLEAIHCRHYVRYLKQQAADGRLTLGQWPTTFAEHAVWYSMHPALLQQTVLGARHATKGSPFPQGQDTVASLAERLGPRRPVLFRCMTPPALASDGLDWHVLRVVVPGLQPLHGNHHLAHLGGPLWAPRGLAEWGAMPPHPMP